ncbi:hypothetical protein [Nocardia pseudovaccinii]|uniref:hypothetical protein n=1 Tax=Nocardia pseudovaccinii TaxID=189540 RepID=UPI000A544920|nr:hypothetical protein [Nocardia pseudovaccinii]
MSGQQYGVSTRTLTVLVYVVSFVWSANLLAPLIIHGFQPNTGVNGVMGTMLGLLGGIRYMASRSDKPKKKAAEDE